ncbi:MAG: PTS sugar transporter subunit IIB [Gemmatimonadetes bacterium]|nr:PTS sugar transporter subunit IIB [Gemmatimonadota bacterium]NNF14524.1 PTS sugar transporter subunit IIB [Gemmatimonadota bacterium]
MGIVLLRVDERLIHGQVVIGWGHELRPDRYVLVDDELAGSQWEQDLYRLAVVDTEVDFVDVESARQKLAEWREDHRRSIVLTRDVATMRRLGEGGLLSGEKVNLGGIHHGPGRAEVLRYLHLTQQDRADLMALAEEGAQVSARDLPDAPKVALATLLED